MSTPQGDSVKRKLGDRRIRPRFDIVGDLWGTLEAALPLPLKNVGRGGALIESAVSLPTESVHRVTFRSDGEDIAASVRVRHVRTETSDSGQRMFLIGLEFMAAPPVLLERIDKWLLESHGGMAAMEG